MKRKGGPPSTYTQEMGDIICERLVCGKDGEPESLRKICLDPDMPALRTVMKWLTKHDDFVQQYARARELQQEVRLEEIHEIADNATDDIMFLTAEDGDGEGGKAVIKHSAIQRAKLQIDTRKWAMSKLAPKKYGDKIQQEVTGSNGSPLEIVVRRFTKEENAPG